VNRIVPLLALVAVAVAVSACGHAAPRAATTTPPAAAYSPPPSATPLIEDTLADQAAGSEWVSDFNSGFASDQQNQLSAWVNNTTHHVDPVLVKDVNTFLTDSQGQVISNDSPDVTKIFDDCHSIGQ
jgi:hypothetical protein